jgi:hypothetical protein
MVNDMQDWTIEDFKTFVKKQVDVLYWITPSAVVLKSFYVGDVIKPKEITVTKFVWLRSIAEKVIKDYKSLNAHPGGKEGI